MKTDSVNAGQRVQSVEVVIILHFAITPASHARCRNWEHVHFPLCRGLRGDRRVIREIEYNENTRVFG